ncbi:MAG: sortase [Firmicutes bacterium]|nr:sortase [Bacillota bacterium]
MRNKIFTYGGLLLFAVALCMTALHFIDERNAAKSTFVITDHVNLMTKPNERTKDENIPSYILTPEMDMPTVEIDGNLYIGVLCLPSLELSLPVMSDWSYEKLKLSPCRYAGSAYSNDMIVAAHNYQSHFGGLKNLNVGDEVKFTDVEGNEFLYSVEKIFQLDSNEIDEMESGEWDLTLFTCTISGYGRITVRCKQKNE